MLKVTLDHNCWISLFDNQHLAETQDDELIKLRMIIELDENGLIEIAKTTRIEADTRKDEDNQRILEINQYLEKYPTIGSIFRFDLSKFGSGDFFAGPETTDMTNNIQNIIFPGGIDNTNKRSTNKWCDVDHLAAHWHAKRDFFITLDIRDIGKKSKVEKLKLIGINVVSPDEFINLFQTRY